MCLAKLFIWIDEDPETAFERAALLFDFAEVSWDMTRILWNGGVDVFNAGIIPIWNTATYYLIEPTITLTLEVFSLIFMKQHWAGVITEEQFPYNGLDCMASPESAAWCGRYGFYKAELEAPERAAVFVDESESFVRRMMLQVPDNRTFTFGLATARRLQEQSGGGFSAPSFETTALTSALNEFSVFFITMVPSLLDVVFGVLGDIIKTSFSVLMDALFMVLKSIMMVLKMLLKSGMLTTVVTIGVDFAIIVKRATLNLFSLQPTNCPLSCLRRCSPRLRCLCSLRPSTGSCASWTTSSRAAGMSSWSNARRSCIHTPRMCGSLDQAHSHSLACAGA